MSKQTKWNWQKDDWPNWQLDGDCLTDFEQQFLLSSGQLMEAWRHLASQDQERLQIDLLSDEAIKTSEIEGEYLDRASVQSSVRRQFGLQTDDKSRPAESGIAELMVACFEDFDAPLDHQTLFDWHEMICRGRGDLSIIGGYRTHPEAMQVVSGALHTPKIHFEAPPSAQMHHEMTRFLTWFEIVRLPALTKAGLAHLWFVSIHPFEDGNGRIARALCEKCFASALGQPSMLALSRQIEKDRKHYYQALEDSNKGMEVTDWLVWFSEAALKAQSYSIAMIHHLIAKTKMMDRLRGQLNPRQEKALLRMFEAGPEGFVGGLSSGNYIAITKAATATATRDLKDLVAKGALRRTGERKGTRYWLDL